MKIAIISGKDPHYKSDTDGSTIIPANMAKHYSRLGHKVDIYIPLGFSGHHYLPRKADDQLELPNTLYPSVSIKRFSVPNVLSTEDCSEDQKFVKRLEIARAEGSYFDNQQLRSYDLVLILHVMHAIGVVE